MEHKPKSTPEIKKKTNNQKKKWTEDEICTILVYLSENDNIEAPTAQIYYKKLIETTGISATWDLVRWKVRHLKSTYIKANDWRKSTGAGLLESDSGVSTVEGKILKICPHYKQLNSIYGEKSVDDAVTVVDSGYVEDYCIQLEASDHNYTQICESLSLSDSELSNNPTQQAAAEETESSATTKSAQKSKEFAEKLRRNAPKSSSSHLAAFQQERTEMCKLKIEWEKEKHEQDVMIAEKRIKLEEDKLKS